MSINTTPPITADEPSRDDLKTDFDREFTADDSTFEAMEDVSWNCTILCSGGCI